MWLVVLETATPTLSVALLKDGNPVVEHNEQSKRRHAETVAPTIAALLGAMGLEPKDLGLWSAGGPGSYRAEDRLSTPKGWLSRLTYRLLQSAL